MIKPDLFVELSTEEQQLLSGGERCVWRRYCSPTSPAGKKCGSGQQCCGGVENGLCDGQCISRNQACP